MKLDDRIKWLDDHTQEYLRLIEETDKEEDSEGTLTKAELEAKLKEAQERLERYGKDVFGVACALKVPAKLAVQQLILVDIREKADHTATSMMLIPCEMSSSTVSFCRRFALVTVSVITLCSVLVVVAISFLTAGF